jgi:hypothetical protein
LSVLHVSQRSQHANYASAKTQLSPQVVVWSGIRI